MTPESPRCRGIKTCLRCRGTQQIEIKDPKAHDPPREGQLVDWGSPQWGKGVGSFDLTNDRIAPLGILHVEDLPGVEDVARVPGPFDRPGHAEVGLIHLVGMPFYFPSPRKPASALLSDS
jgi:hypothetical protein